MRVLYIAVHVVMSALALSASAIAPVALASPARVSARHSAPTLELGSRGTAVRTLQNELERLSYLPAGAADGRFGIRTWHAVVAFQGWSGLDRDGIAGPRHAGRSRTRAGRRRGRRAEGFEVHIAQQVLLLVRGGRVQRAIHVSTGRPGWPTPVGHFTVLERDPMSWSAPFQVWMPLAQYFYDGFAIHEFPEVPAYPASHGCIRVPSVEAHRVAVR